MQITINDIAELFEPRGEALKILAGTLKSTKKGKKITIGRDTEISLEYFYKQQHKAFLKRKKHNIRHSIDILVNELSNNLPPKVLCSSRELPVSLDYYDDRIDQEGEYELKYGSFRR